MKHSPVRTCPLLLHNPTAPISIITPSYVVAVHFKVNNCSTINPHFINPHHHQPTLTILHTFGAENAEENVKFPIMLKIIN